MDMSQRLGVYFCILYTKETDIDITISTDPVWEMTYHLGKSFLPNAWSEKRESECSYYTGFPLFKSAVAVFFLLWSGESYHVFSLRILPFWHFSNRKALESTYNNLIRNCLFLYIIWLKYNFYNFQFVDWFVFYDTKIFSKFEFRLM